MRHHLTKFLYSRLRSNGTKFKSEKEHCRDTGNRSINWEHPESKKWIFYKNNTLNSLYYVLFTNLIIEREFVFNEKNNNLILHDIVSISVRRYLWVSSPIKLVSLWTPYKESEKPLSPPVSRILWEKVKTIFNIKRSQN